MRVAKLVNLRTGIPPNKVNYTLKGINHP